MKDLKKYLAEFIGTFVVVLFACGVAGQTCGAPTEGSGYLITALAFGLVIVAMAYSIGNISGCHINPAVSIAMLVNGKMSTKDFCGYVVAQFLGAIAGAAVLMGIVGDAGKLGTNALAARMAKIKQEIGEYWEPLPPIFATSSKSGAGREEILDYIETVMRDMDNMEQ